MPLSIQNQNDVNSICHYQYRIKFMVVVSLSFCFDAGICWHVYRVAWGWVKCITDSQESSTTWLRFRHVVIGRKLSKSTHTHQKKKKTKQLNKNPQYIWSYNGTNSHVVFGHVYIYQFYFAVALLTKNACVYVVHQFIQIIRLLW